MIALLCCFAAYGAVNWYILQMLVNQKNQFHKQMLTQIINERNLFLDTQEEYMQLSKRLQLVASFVSKGKMTADIGTDHGYVPIYLVRNQAVPYVYACDVNKGPLERATAHIAEAGLTGQIETRLGSGLSVLKPGEAEAVVIAGMGGPLIQRLLEESSDVVASVAELILSPHSEVDGVRKYLHKAGFCIIQEAMIYDEGKFYTVLKAVPGQEEAYTETEYRFGKLLIQAGDKVFLDYLQDCIRKLEALQDRLTEAGLTEESPRFMQNAQELDEVKQLYGKLNVK